MNKLSTTFVGLIGMFFLATGCGGTAPEVAHPTFETDPGAATAAEVDDGMTIEGIMGTIPEEDVRSTVERRMGSLLKCYEEGVDINDAVEGQIRIAMEVAGDGSVTKAFVKDSELGSALTEQCLVGKMYKLTFPKPQGGGVAEISYSFVFEAPYEPPTIEEWSEEHLAEKIEQSTPQIDTCKASHGGIELIFFVDKTGKVLSAGASVKDFEGHDAAHCLVGLVSSWTFEPPKADLAKATLYF